MSLFRYRSLWFLLLLGALVAAFVSPLLVLALIFVFLAIFFLARNLEFGLIILVFFFPYLGLVIDFGSFKALREVPYLTNINAPFIDLYGLLLFIAWLLRSILNPKSEIRMSNQSQMSKSKHSSFVTRVSSLFPYWKSYLPFWLSGLVSLSRVANLHFATSLKYLVRPVTFFYLIFFAPVVQILKTRTPEFLNRVIVVFYCTGLISALNGLLGLIFGVHADFPRAQPFGFFGVNPLGPNHNLLAETLIATAPAGLLLATRPLIGNAKVRESDQGVRGGSRIFSRSGIYYGMWFQWAIALLTFARTAWIAVAVQAVLYLWLIGGRRTEDGGRIRLPFSVFRHLRQYWPAALAVTLAVVVFLGITISSETVRGSTLSRLDQARIATFYFVRSPWIGQGVGTFIPTLWQTRAYLLEYGEPLEAHGIVWKLLFEQGILGLATFGIFVGAILYGIYNQAAKSIRENTRTVLIAALMIAAGSLTYQLFNTTYYTSKLWVPLAIAVAIGNQAAKNRREQNANG